MPSHLLDNQITLLEHSTFDRILAAAIAWLIPGAGYWLLGYRTRALLFAVLLLGLFWTGELLLAGNGNGQFMAVTYQVHPVFFVLELGNGLSTLLANFIWGAAAHVDGLNDNQGHAKASEPGDSLLLYQWSAECPPRAECPRQENLAAGGGKSVNPAG